MIDQLPVPSTKEKEQLICRIDLSFIDLKDNRRNTVSKECYIELYERHLTYKITGIYEALDEDSGIWKDKRANYRWCRSRNAISDINMIYDNTYDTYCVGLEFSGVADGNSWHYDDPKECLRIYEILRDYMIST